MTDDPADIVLPEGVGPHEGRELELMLAGRKPLAAFTDTIPTSFEIPEAAFAPHVAAGAIVRREHVYRMPGERYDTRKVYFALPDQAWRIDALVAIEQPIFTGARPATDTDEIETGRLLGYAEEEISVYLKWTNERRLGQNKLTKSE